MEKLGGYFCGVSLILWGAALFFGCSSIADGDPIGLEPGSVSSVKSSSSVECDSCKIESSSSGNVVDSSEVYSVLDSLVGIVKVPASKLSRGSTVYNIDEFNISATEITQGVYLQFMGVLPVMDKKGDSVAVANVGWYDAALFCNALSKYLALDTAYVYDGLDKFGNLRDLSINYKVRAVRLPTETEWEIAARAGTTTAYYWNTQPAAKYAYYAQTNGPVKVAQYLPNDFGLYDMGGNVAEWVNDWYSAYSTKSERNPVGAASGEYKVVRGGGWSDKVASLASAERDKKSPTTQSQMIGFRIVYSAGF